MVSVLSARQAGKCLFVTKIQDGLYCFGQLGLYPFGQPISPTTLQIGNTISFSLAFIFAKHSFVFNKTSRELTNNIKNRFLLSIIR